MSATTSTVPRQEPISPQGRPSHSPGRARGGLASLAAASLSLMAALIHLWVAPEHFAEWWGHGAFFMISAACQGLFAVMILRWPASNTVLFAGIAGNLVIVLLYVISRTWGMPFGADWILFSPSVAHLEDPDLLGMLATAAELGIIAASVALLDARPRRLIVNVLLLVGAGVWALRIFGILP